MYIENPLKTSAHHVQALFSYKDNHCVLNGLLITMKTSAHRVHGQPCWSWSHTGGGWRLGLDHQRTSVDVVQAHLWVQRDRDDRSHQNPNWRSASWSPRPAATIMFKWVSLYVQPLVGQRWVENVGLCATSWSANWAAKLCSSQGQFTHDLWSLKKTTDRILMPHCHLCRA